MNSYKIFQAIMLFVFSFGLYNCANDPLEEITVYTKEEVAKKWLNHFYKNQFDSAKIYSTLVTREKLDTLEKIMFEEEGSLESDFIIKFKKCNQINDSSVFCSFIIEDDLDSFKDSIILLLKDSIWLVDDTVLESDTGEDPLDF